MSMHVPNNLFSIKAILVRNFVSRSPLWRTYLLVYLVPVWLSPLALAVTPPPDGGYSGANTAEGTNALFSLTNGANNTAVGFQALFSNTNGRDNTANGSNALTSNTIGTDNTANGVNALLSNTTGGYNAASGTGALKANTSGNNNTANGYRALYSNTTGVQNTANGAGALYSNTIGKYNTANGVNALLSNTTGNYNTANGVGALKGSTGANNTANGFQALVSNTTGNSNIALGFSAGGNLTTGSNNIDIGNAGSAGESNTIRIGTTGTQTATFIAGISGTTTANANAVPVVIDSAGQLGTISSSRRFKDEIKPMDNSSEAIFGLKPVTFHYKIDKQNTPQFGLIAEEVAKVDPDLVVRDDNGEIYTVRYEEVNAMLLNEFLKEHRRVEQQDARLAKQETTIAQQKKDFASQLARQQKAFEAKFAQQQQQVEALTATVQKVSNQLELNKSAHQVVANNE